MSQSFKTSQDLYGANKPLYLPGGSIDLRIFIVSKWIGENKRILDVGCYNGLYAEIFKRNNNEVYGIDASVDAIEEAKKRGIKAEVADLESPFSYPDEFFDIIYAGEIIEHLYDTDNFILECKRVLKKDGYLIITTPNVLSFPRRILYLFGNGRFFEASPTFATEKKVAGHIRFFTKKLLRDFIELLGFELKRFASDYVNFPLGIRSRWLAKIKPTFGKTLIMEFKKTN